MFYILIQFNNQGNPFQAYQEIYNGYVQRYTDLNGNTIIEPPGGSHVLNANPPQPPWALPDPPPPPAEPSIRYVAPDVLLNRFTDAELRSITQSAKSNAANQQYISVLLLQIQSSRSIKIGTPTRISAGIEALESNGVIGVGRAALILAVPDEESSPVPLTVATLKT